MKRYNDAGAQLGQAFRINRATGNITITGSGTIASGSLANAWLRLGANGLGMDDNKIFFAADGHFGAGYVLNIKNGTSIKIQVNSSGTFLMM